MGHLRWGFCRAYHDARAEGWTVNHKKLQRLWREERLRMPIRGCPPWVVAGSPVDHPAFSSK